MERASLARRCVLRGAANGFRRPCLTAFARARRSRQARRKPSGGQGSALRSAGQVGHLIFNVGAPSSMDTFDPKPALNRLAGEPMPESFGKVGGQFTDGSPPSWGRRGIQALRPQRPARFRVVSPRRPPRGRHLLRPFVFHPQRRSCACDVRGSQRPPVRYAPEHRRLGDLRPGRGIGEPAGLCRHAAARGHSRGRNVLLEPRLPAVGLSRNAAPPGAEPDSRSQAPGSDERRAPAPHARFSTADEPPRRRRIRQRDGRPRGLLRVGLPHAVPRARSRRPGRGKAPASNAEYGLEQERTRDFGARLLLARRLVERGVRFIQIYSGGGPISMQWDAP